MTSPAFRAALLALLSGIAITAACSASDDGSKFGDGSDDDDSSGNGSGGSGGLGLSSSNGSGGGILKEPPPCDGDHTDKDDDGDGWTGGEGDCNDCTEQMNPGAQDYDGNNVDEDCNGTNDDNPTDCDAAVLTATTDPMDAAKALGLCKLATADSWGVMEAKWVRSDGQPIAGPPLSDGYGVLQAFGPNVQPQEGFKMLAVSSGSARVPGDPQYQSVGGYWKDFTPHGPAPGYPKESPSCPGVMTGEPYDSAGLELRIRTPSNAKSLSFNLDFYTYEFPGWICTTFNDYFVALLTPTPSGQTDGNISFDSQGNTISVNAGFLEVCYAQMAGGKNFPCALGPTQLMGTGYDEQPNGSAATGWLQTTSAVELPGGEITITFSIWDSGDGVLDSTTLLDNFRFDVDEAPTTTKPIPDPK